jgi:hypothetical protein
MIFTILYKFKKRATPRVAVGVEPRKKCEEAMPRAAVGVALPYAEGFYMPRVAVGVSWPTPRVQLRRRLTPWADLARVYADGPDFWPSA